MGWFTQRPAEHLPMAAGLLEGPATEMAEIGDSRLGTEHLPLAALKYRPGYL